MTRANSDVRKRAKDAGVFLYQIAADMGVSEPTMTRKLRYELPLEEKNRFFEIIERIKSEQEAGAAV